MLDLAAAVIAVNNFFTRQCAFFESDLREVSAKLVVLVLGPLLKWMIVAFVAVEADAKESLAHVFSDLARIAQNAEIIHGRIFEGTAFGEQHAADHFVVR